MTDRPRRGPEEPRFYLDEDVPHTATDVGAELGLDIVSARDAQSSLPQDDPVHLGTAAGDRRIMVTYNRDDFLTATRDAFTSGAPHAGLLILTHKLPRDPTRVANALARWVEKRKQDGAWPLQEYEVDFLSHQESRSRHAGGGTSRQTVTGPGGGAGKTKPNSVDLNPPAPPGPRTPRGTG